MAAQFALLNAVVRVEHDAEADSTTVAVRPEPQLGRCRHTHMVEF
jgi:hypothetical protein